MAITVSYSSQTFAGATSGVPLPVGFNAVDPTTIKLATQLIGGDPVPVDPGDYTVNTLGPGSFEVVPDLTYPGTTAVIVYRSTPRVQPVDLAEGGPLPAESINDGLDNLERQIQELWAAFASSGASLFGPPGTVTINGIKVFDDSADRANTAPDYVPQVGVQADTRNIYIANGLTAGAWSLYSGGSASGNVTAADPFAVANRVILSANDSRGIKDSPALEVLNDAFLVPTTDLGAVLGRLDRRFLVAYLGQLSVNAATTGSRDIVDQDCVVYCDTSGGNVTMTLPPANLCIGRLLIFKKTSADANTLTVARNLFNIDGVAADLVISAQNAAYAIQSAGTNGWEIVANYLPGGGTYTAGTGLTLVGTTFAIGPSVVTLTGTQSLSGKTYNGLTINSTGGSLTIGTGSDIELTSLTDLLVDVSGGGKLTLQTNGPTVVTYNGGWPLTFSTVAPTTLTLPTTGILATRAGSEALTNKSVNGVTLVSGGSASLVLSQAGTYVPVGGTYTAGGGIAIVGSVISIDASLVVTRTGAQTVQNKTITLSSYNGVALTTGGSALNFLDETGAYSHAVTPGSVDTLTNKIYVPASTVLTPAATVDWNMVTASAATFTPTANGQVITPLGSVVKDVTYDLQIRQGATPYTVAWSAEFVWPGGVAPTLSGANKLDIFTFKSDGSFLYGSTLGLNYT